MDRPRGGFAPIVDEKVEPERTERLLRRPLRLFREEHSDALDSLKLAWLVRAGGFSFAGLTYDFVVLVASIVIGGLNGGGSNIAAGSSEATAQVVMVFTVCCAAELNDPPFALSSQSMLPYGFPQIQYGCALWVFAMRPSADRVDNVIQGTQLLLEGSQTGVLLLGAFQLSSMNDPLAANAFISMGFWLGLMALFLPLFEKIYDAVITQVSTYIRGECDPKGAVIAWIALLLTIPSLFLGYLGYDAGEASDALGLADQVLARPLSKAQTNRCEIRLTNVDSTACSRASTVRHRRRRDGGGRQRDHGHHRGWLS